MLVSKATLSIRLALALAGILAASAQALADWSGEGEGGLVVTRGNTDTDTLNAQLAIGKQHAQWRHALRLTALRSTNEGVTNAERYKFLEQSNYKIDERSYWFGALRYENDRFSGFDYQSSLSGGYGRVLIDNEVTKLNGDIVSVTAAVDRWVPMPRAMRYCAAA